MTEEKTKSYRFTRGSRAIVAEVHFPKKVVYQSPIYLTLEAGLKEQVVKDYISDNIRDIMGEMSDYPQLFDPLQYVRKRMPVRFHIPKPEEALRRIEKYQSHFTGWSMYEVDGTFLNELKGRIDDERTQVIRLIFRLVSAYEHEAKKQGCYDVLEAVRRWVMAEHFRLDHILPWSEAELRRFITLHGSWPKYKRLFLEKYYVEVTKEAKKWIDDTGLFVFGFLVRRFWTEITKLGHEEDEIWVVNNFNANLNTVIGMPVTITTQP